MLLRAQVLCYTSTEYRVLGGAKGHVIGRGWDSPVWQGIFPFTSALLRTRCSTMMTTSCYVLVFSDSDNEGLKFVDHRRACGELGGLRERSGIGQYVSTVAWGRCDLG